MPRHLTRTVAVEGHSGVASLTWGQQSIWRSIQWLRGDDAYFNVGLLVDVPAAAGLDDVLGAVRALVERHGALRTLVVESEEGPLQSVEGSGQVDVDVYDAAAPRARALAAAALNTVVAKPFRHTEEWPIRVGVICVDGDPVHLFVALSHLAVDGWATHLIRDDLTALLSDREHVFAAAAWQPLDQAARERATPPRKAAAALDHWRSSLDRAPRSMFDFERAPAVGAERFVRLALHSRALAGAANQVAKRRGVSTSTVVLAATAAVLGAWTGHDQTAVQLIATHRMDPAGRGLVAPANCDTPFVVDTAHGRFSDLLARTAAGALRAYRFGHCDPGAVRSLRAEIAADRGGPVDVQAASFNDVRSFDAWRVGPEVMTPAGVREATRDSAISFVGAWPRQDLKIFLTVGDTPDAARLVLTADTAYVPRPAMEHLLRAIESLLVLALTSDMALDALPELLLLPRAPRGERWRRVGGDHVDIGALRDLLCETTGCATTWCTVENRDGADVLVAYLPADTLRVPVDAVHGLVVAAVGERTDVQAPHLYVVTHGAPAEAGSGAAWRAAAVAAESRARNNS